MKTQKKLLIIVIMAFAIIAIAVLQRLNRETPIKNAEQFPQPSSQEALFAKGHSPLPYTIRLERHLYFVPLAARETYCSSHKVALLKDNVPVVHKSLYEKPEYAEFVKYGYTPLEKMFPNTWREIVLGGSPPSVLTGPLPSTEYVSAEVHFCPRCRIAEDTFYSDFKSTKVHWVTNSVNYAFLD